MYPCSYLIYSSAFDALPGPMKDYVYRGLHEILAGDNPPFDVSHLSSRDKRAVLEILRETKKGLPDYFMTD